MLNHAVFSKNRDRLLTSAVAQRFFAQVNQHAKRFMSDEHFAVDGTLKRIRRNFTLPAPAREILGNMNSISVLILFFSLWPFSGGKTYHMTADGSVPARMFYGNKRGAPKDALRNTGIASSILRRTDPCWTLVFGSFIARAVPLRPDGLPPRSLILPLGWAYDGQARPVPFSFFLVKNDEGFRK